MTAARALCLAGAALLLGACATAPRKPAPAAASKPGPAATARNAPRRSPYAPAQEDPAKRGNYTPGGLYAPDVQDSVPAQTLADVDQIPEPDVVDLPHSAYGNRSPYVVLGKTYTVLDNAHGYDETGYASYYGQKFHGRRTSNLEVYDMYAFTAAHRTLPLPSFARVTNLDNGKSVIVRINDRGPFHDGRLVDLSFAAAVKLGVYPHGTARVRVHGLTAADMPDEGQRLAGGAGATKAHDAPGRGAVDAGATTVVAQVASTAADARGAGGPSSVAYADHTDAAPAGAASGTPPARDKDWRFDMRQDGRTMSADEFDAWMRARRARVATGKPQAVPSPNPVAGAAAAPAPARAVATTPASPQAEAPAASSPADAVTLQVASFAARANAERALAMLTGAGIGNARLLDADANGRKVWRLRISPVDPARIAELGSRLQGLGFGQPQRVRE